jgi:hypothetical protein
MNIFEIIGWIALSLNVWGNLALAKKSNFGWLIRLACNVAWVFYSVYFEVWPLLVNHILFAGINIYGWFEWTKNIYKCSCGIKYENPKYGTNCICEMPIRK